MTPLYTFNGLLLKIGNALAAGVNCCCEESCCCLDFANVNFSFTIDCGFGNETGTGTLDNLGSAGYDNETGNWIVSIICTTSEFDCDGLGVFIGYVISVTRFVPSYCEGWAKYVCGGDPNNFVGGNCISRPNANFTTDLFSNPFYGPPCNTIGSITFS